MKGVNKAQAGELESYSIFYGHLKAGRLCSQGLQVVVSEAWKSADFV